ncbi:MAG: hypothetical protein QGF59_15515, partial [Pirellulaceae bacterium]|nr:hypothetical protein [Pirellulaceae bacterium]
NFETVDSILMDSLRTRFSRHKSKGSLLRFSLGKRVIYGLGATRMGKPSSKVVWIGLLGLF